MACPDAEAVLRHPYRNKSTLTESLLFDNADSRDSVVERDGQPSLAWSVARDAPLSQRRQLPLLGRLESILLSNLVQ